jgi:hypothetical protein
MAVWRCGFGRVVSSSHSLETPLSAPTPLPGSDNGHFSLKPPCPREIEQRTLGGMRADREPDLWLAFTTRRRKGR